MSGWDLIILSGLIIALFFKETIHRTRLMCINFHKIEKISKIHLPCSLGFHIENIQSEWRRKRRFYNRAYRFDELRYQIYYYQPQQRWANILRAKRKPYLSLISLIQ